MLDLALQPDGASQQRGQHQAQQRDTGPGHLVVQDRRNMLPEWHENLSGWILSPENLVLDGFRRPRVNANDYRLGIRAW